VKKTALVRKAARGHGTYSAMPSSPQASVPRLALALTLILGCGSGSFEPPKSPAHDKEEDGALHAERNESPFLCGDADGDPTPCPTERPADDRLSCDASGCHGGFEFSRSAPGFVRHLLGGEAPSCWSCHDDEWNDE